MPDQQFGFRPGLGCAYALFSLAAILADSHESGDLIVIGAFDVRRAFDSSIQAQALLAAYQQGINLRVTSALYNMYFRLEARIKIGNRITSEVVPVKKGVRQGSLLSPSLYSNSVLNAQACVNVSPMYLQEYKCVATYIRGRSIKSKSVY
ncbi:uncharacterized protein LOC136034310 [Artemia franciscana]|uniref:uncharacterized protein LOC136034310 n=1 Tax=Artemia franciscana TaxID=6661 RepID=UPI0032DAE081